MIGLALEGVVKDYRGLRPLRVAHLEVAIGERVAVAGFDVGSAEVFINLATGAALPDTGDVRVLGQPTRAITDGDLWLASLDRFGIVSHRAVLLDGVTVEQNIALSFSLAIEPIPPLIRAQVAELAQTGGITSAELETAAGAVSAATKMRVHLARALALDPQVLVLEHPTLGVERDHVEALAASMTAATEGRALAMLALTDDDVFAKGWAQRRLRLNAGTGVLKGERPHLFRWFS
ncbi:MAG: hypothetical protein M3R55_06265 [Acidobacteriota bacterium]|nr:hypothetical protein [Acidobacteriota bacterium]